ncbi:MAG: hypothetical protein HC817_06405 [Saprospiraceae bacterium]|nr:hypothetical protein [Saprospiraceae bacterium]
MKTNEYVCLIKMIFSPFQLTSLMNTTAPNSLSEAIELVKSKGFYTDLTWDEDCLYCAKEHVHFAPNEFAVAHHFSVPDDAKADTEMHVFALASHSLRVRGYMVCDTGSLSFYPFVQKHLLG